jgi:hypothetical protein
MNNLFNPKDKVKVRRNQDLINYTILHLSEQKYRHHIYKTKPNQLLIHDKDGKYKIVSKNYALYHMDNDEYNTETELDDEDFINEEKRIKEKYSY